jgi:hypothetical protein
MNDIQLYDQLFPFAFLASVIVKTQAGKKAASISPKTFIGDRPTRQKATKSNPQSTSKSQRQQDVDEARRLGVKVPS